MKHLLATAVLAAGFALPALAETFPAQHWASQGGIVDIHPNGANVWSTEQLVDIKLIEEAFGRWALFYDEGRSDLLPSLLTEDVVVNVRLGDPEPMGVFEGVPAVAKYNDDTLAVQLDQRRHLMTNILVDSLDGTTATATAFGLVMQMADGLKLGAMVFYTSDLVKGEDGVWRFARLDINIDDYAGNLN